MQHILLRRVFCVTAGTFVGTAGIGVNKNVANYNNDGTASTIVTHFDFICWSTDACV